MEKIILKQKYMYVVIHILSCFIKNLARKNPKKNTMHIYSLGGYHIQLFMSIISKKRVMFVKDKCTFTLNRIDNYMYYIFVSFPFMYYSNVRKLGSSNLLHKSWFSCLIKKKEEKFLLWNRSSSGLRNLQARIFFFHFSSLKKKNMTT